MVDADELRELMDYDPDTGVFVRRVRAGKALAGAVAGYVTERGYYAVGIKGRAYYSHRLAWLWMMGKWPAEEIDHIDLCPGNNRWENLREATRSQNCGNRWAQSNNTSGFKGVSPHKNKFQVSIGVNGKCIHLGCSNTAAGAYELYKIAAREYFGEFARS